MTLDSLVGRYFIEGMQQQDGNLILRLAGHSDAYILPLALPLAAHLSKFDVGDTLGIKTVAGEMFITRHPLSVKQV
jgi:hypothetical protein